MLCTRSTSPSTSWLVRVLSCVVVQHLQVVQLCMIMPQFALFEVLQCVCKFTEA